MTVKTYEFEGQQRTVSEVAKIVTALDIGTVRKYLQQGMTTRTQMLTRPKPSLKPGKGGKSTNCRMYFRATGR
jgi:hypothetical protein